MSHYKKLAKTTLTLTMLLAACTSRPITKDKPREVVRKDPGTTWESAGVKATGVEKATAAKDVKPVAARSWETGGAEKKLSLGKHAKGKSGAEFSSGGFGGRGLGAAGKARSAPSGPAPLMGLSPSPSGRSSLTEGRSRRQPELSSDILTAGSFDDGDDIKLFQKFWNSSELIKSNELGALEQADWSRRMKRANGKKHTKLQLAFVVDTTGSMGDELEYLKAEFKSIVQEVDRSHPGVEKSFAFIAYRDEGDEYLTRGLSFTKDVEQVHSFIAAQSANGGGDYPEAVHTALEEAFTRLDWEKSNNTARMLFHIADAPAHGHAMKNTFATVEKLADAGVSVFPVAASGVLDIAEAVMRATALLTGGKYIFLTDDSGVGLPHAAPKHPCYNVEKLKDIMVREIKDRISGTRSFPVAKNIIRQGGDQTAGICRTRQNVVGQW